MNSDWRETLWKIVQNEMDHFVENIADKPFDFDDEYQEFDDEILECRVQELERLGERGDKTPDHNSHTIQYRYLKRADLLTDLRAVEYIRLFNKDRAKQHRVSKGFRKAYSICPRDLGKEFTRAPREVIDTLNKRADLIFSKMNKLHVDSFKRINEGAEFILETWLRGEEYDQAKIKHSEAQVSVHYDALNVAFWGTNMTVDNDDITSYGDDSSVVEEVGNLRGSGVAVSSSPHRLQAQDGLLPQRV